MTPGDPATTARAIMDSEGMFRLGIVGRFLAAVLDVLVAWALLRVFSPVSKGVSMLAAWFRISYVAVLMVAISQLVGVLRLLGSDVYLTAFNTDQRNAQVLLRIDEFKDISTKGPGPIFPRSPSLVSLLAFWLLIWGRRISLGRAALHEDQVA